MFRAFVLFVYVAPTHGYGDNLTWEASFFPHDSSLIPVRQQSGPPPIRTFSVEERRALPMAMVVYVSPDSPADAKETYKNLLWLMECYAARHDVAFILDTSPVRMPAFMAAHQHDPLTWRYRCQALRVDNSVPRSLG
jgi:hypothetical protein